MQNLVQRRHFHATISSCFGLYITTIIYFMKLCSGLTTCMIKKLSNVINLNKHFSLNILTSLVHANCQSANEGLVKSSSKSIPAKSSSDIIMWVVILWNEIKRSPEMPISMRNSITLPFCPYVHGRPFLRKIQEVLQVQSHLFHLTI